MRRISVITLIGVVILGMFCVSGCAKDRWSIRKGVLHIPTQEALSAFIAYTETNNQGDEMKAKVKEILFGDEVYFIPDSAFREYKELVRISLGKNVNEIGEIAFLRCEKLEDVEWNAMLRTICADAFYASGLKILHLPDGVERIEDGAFVGCKDLQSVYLPDSVTFLDNNFTGCNSLETIKLSSSLRVIAAYLCASKNLLREIYIPESVEIWEEYAFAHSGVERIIIGGQLTAIYAFKESKYPSLQQLVFLAGPPLQIDLPEDGSIDPYVGAPSREWFGFLDSPENARITIYILRENAALWAPNGETEWNSCPLVVIDSIDDLPPLE